jgi:small conductance mechanosensitive channel
MTFFNIAQVQPADTLNQIQAELTAMAEKLATTPADVLLSDLMDKAVAFGLKVLAALLIYLIGAWLIRKIKRVISRIFTRRDTDPAIASFVLSIISIAMTIILVITTVGVLGVDTTSLAALLAGGGMAIGMALNGTVQNFAGGIMILAFRPFKSGDYIQFGEFEGTVSEVNIVSTKLTTVDNRTIIIPNGALSNGTINNFSHNNVRRVDWLIDVEYGTDVEKAKELLKIMIEADSRILTKENGAPADPFIGLSALASSSIQIVARAWVNKADYWPVKFDMNETVYKELPKHGINFPYQKIDVTIMNPNQIS